MASEDATWMEWSARQMKQVALVMSQATAAQARIQGMVALNQYRLSRGQTIAFDEAAFEEVIKEFGLNHNSVHSTLECPW